MYLMSASLFGCGTALAYRYHLSATIGAAVGAGMVRKPRLFALWTNLQLRNLDLVMLAPEALARVGLAFLWQRAHTLLLILIIAQYGRAAGETSRSAPAHICAHLRISMYVPDRRVSRTHKAVRHARFS